MRISNVETRLDLAQFAVQIWARLDTRPANPGKKSRPGPGRALLVWRALLLLCCATQLLVCSLILTLMYIDMINIHRTNGPLNTINALKFVNLSAKLRSSLASGYFMDLCYQFCLSVRILQVSIPISGGETHFQIPVYNSVLSMEALEGALNKYKRSYQRHLLQIV